MAEASNWQPVCVDLAYRLGEKKLFSVALNGFANRAHFTRTAPYESPPIPGSEGAPGARFLFYPCYPVAYEPAVFQRSDNWLVYTSYTFNNYFIDIKAIGTFDAYIKRFSSKSRSTLLRKIRKFEEASGGPIAWREFRAAEQMEEFLQIAGPLSASTYQARLLGCGLPQSAEFLNEAKARARAGEVRAFLLLLRDKPIAYVFCFCSEGVVTYDYVGFDVAAGDLSPGTVLQYLMLQSLFGDPNCQIFDFTEGEGAQKKFFGTDSRRCAKSYFLPQSFRTVVLVRSHHLLNGAVAAIGHTLDRWGIKSKVRALIRRFA